MIKRFCFSDGQTTVEQDIRLVKSGDEWYCDEWVSQWIAEMKRQGFHYLRCRLITPLDAVAASVSARLRADMLATDEAGW